MNSPQVFNSTPITPRMEPQITRSRQNIPQSVKSTEGESGATCAIGENGAAVGEGGATYAEPHVNMNVRNTQTTTDRTGSFQPMIVYGGGSSIQHPISIMNGVPQDTMLNSMSEAGMQGTFNEINAYPPQPVYRNVNQPLFAATQDIQFQPTTDGRTIQQALYSAIPRIELQPNSYATHMNYTRPTYMPSILGTEAPIVSEMQTQSSSGHSREENSLMQTLISAGCDKRPLKGI